MVHKLLSIFCGPLKGIFFRYLPFPDSVKAASTPMYCHRSIMSIYHMYELLKVTNGPVCSQGSSGWGYWWKCLGWWTCQRTAGCSCPGYWTELWTAAEWIRGRHRQTDTNKTNESKISFSPKIQYILKSTCGNLVRQFEYLWTEPSYCVRRYSLDT